MDLFVADFNRLAAQAVQNYRLESAPAILFIYGPPGVGKTALLRRLYDRVKGEGVERSDCGSFSRQYAWAGQTGGFAAFRRFWRSRRLLILDDLHMLKGKTKSVGELFYACEEVSQNGGKLCLTAQGKPGDLAFLGERFISRLLGGLAVPVQSPRLEELDLFIRVECGKLGLELNQDQATQMAGLAGSLAGAVEMLAEFPDLARSSQVSLAHLLPGYLNRWQARRQSRRQPDNIVRVTAEVMSVNPGDMLSKKRQPEVVAARNLAMYAIHYLCRGTYAEIGRFFQREHGGIALACKQVEIQLETETWLRERFRAICRVFENV